MPDERLLLRELLVADFTDEPITVIVSPLVLVFGLLRAEDEITIFDGTLEEHI